MKRPYCVSESVVNEFQQISKKKKCLAINLVQKKDDHVLLHYMALHQLFFFLDWVFANIHIYICYSSLIIVLF